MVCCNPTLHYILLRIRRMKEGRKVRVCMCVCLCVNGWVERYVS